MHADAANISADPEHDHPAKMASGSLRNTLNLADIVNETSSTLSRGCKPDQSDEYGWNDHYAGDQERDLISLRPNPHKRKVEDCEDNKANEISCRHRAIC